MVFSVKFSLSTRYVFNLFFCLPRLEFFKLTQNSDEGKKRWPALIGDVTESSAQLELTYFSVHPPVDDAGLVQVRQYM